MSMLELWGRRNAYNVQKPLWLLAEMQLDFEHHDLGSGTGDLETPEFRALSPLERIPVLRDGDDIVWESNSVLRYLANRFEAVQFYPREALARSQVERWMDWELATLQPAFIDLFWGFYRRPADARDSAAIEDARARCQRCFETLDQRLDDVPFLAGEAFSLADVACGVSLYRYFNMGFAVARPPAVMDWFRRLSQRQAFRHNIMQPFDELKGRTGY